MTAFFFPNGIVPTQLLADNLLYGTNYSKSIQDRLLFDFVLLARKNTIGHQCNRKQSTKVLLSAHTLQPAFFEKKGRAPFFSPSTTSPQPWNQLIVVPRIAW